MTYGFTNTSGSQYLPTEVTDAAGQTTANELELVGPAHGCVCA